ncbi:GFA family protein [uncultured Tolumonas sp.]|uniref:GFA family protein n=1 Tax=uncultured Tolumonas sp. TaxID=263765 RepID=UPI00292F3C22|nr:GFA family protein [uncultured Tolumonas sp.]
MLKGSCLCNAIQYEIEGELGPTMMCHCSKCRKANGSAYAINAAVKTDQFRFFKGQELVSEFESSPGVFRSFCKQCGSPLLSRRPSQPDIVRLRIGTLDTPVDIKPLAHIFVGSKASWDEIHDDIPQYDERP